LRNRNTGATSAGGVRPCAVVARLLAARHLLGAQRVELGGRRVAAIGEPARQHVVEDRAIAVHPLHLVVRTLVVVETEPRHRVDDRALGLHGGALLVGVLDAQDERAAVMAGERPREQRRADVAEMQKTRRARCEAGADGGHDIVDPAKGRRAVATVVAVKRCCAAVTILARHRWEAP
jgi:hypothetical protein